MSKATKINYKEQLDQLMDKLCECPEVQEQTGWSVHTGIVGIADKLVLLCQRLQKENEKLRAKENEKIEALKE